MSDAERTKRKAHLLSQIQQQRLDLSATRRDWLQVTGPYDRGWNTLLSLRSYAMIASSVLAIWSVRHPSLLMRWAKRGFGAWSAWRMIRNTLSQNPR
ncbi:YqjK-like family protein [Cedecea davisae]|uniref:YqjK-like family protein n=1 Tax=Cedecea davisae TaxID=158484 RepID=A0ABS6DEC7_9ENTR|nr:YqjK-like family protein [Cedecea davisae]MBU4681549.1 YqjK-like family protein [Cedecea davisae]MBU4689383.1 YqjK-like family protein [Cedecea davisae]